MDHAADCLGGRREKEVRSDRRCRETPKRAIRIGVNSDPPPIPVAPTRAPTKKPAIAYCGSIDPNSIIDSVPTDCSFNALFAGLG